MICMGRKRGEDGRRQPCQARARVMWEGRWYCGVHDPERVATRDATREADYQRKREQAQRVYQAEQDARAIVEAVAAAPTQVALMGTKCRLIGNEWGELAEQVVAVLKEAKA